MTSLDRSFVGCGEEEYPKGDIVSRTAPVGLGIHGEVLPPQVEMRLLYGDLMDGKPGAGGEEYLRNPKQNDSTCDVNATVSSIVQYYVDQFLAMRNQVDFRLARFRVQLQMNENEESDQIRKAVNASMERDLAACEALSRPCA